MSFTKTNHKTYQYNSS